MTPADIDIIQARIRAATGPDRALDAEIMFDLFAKPVGVHTSDGGPQAYLWPDDDPSWSFGIRFPGKDRAWFEERKEDGGETLIIKRDGAFVLVNARRIRPLTASLDAALALVENVQPGEVDNILAEALEAMWRRGWRDDRPRGPQLARYMLYALFTTLREKSDGKDG